MNNMIFFCNLWPLQWSNFIALRGQKDITAECFPISPDPSEFVAEISTDITKIISLMMSFITTTNTSPQLFCQKTRQHLKPLK